MSTLRLGSCSWKYPSWQGLVYSARRGIDYLAEYARRLRTVEIDQWFWSLFGSESIALPQARTVAEYLAAVDDEFRFTVKAPNAVTLTHFYSRAGSQRGEPNPHFLSAPLFAGFLERIEPIRHLTGSVMLQFEYLNRQKMSGPGELIDRLGAFLEAASSAAAGWPLAVELRNPNYLGRRWFDFLAASRVSHVYCHGYYMPPVPEVYDRFGPPAVSPAVVRLMGTDRAGIEQETGEAWDRVVDPKDGELPRIVTMVEDMIRAGLDVYVNVNNHYEGSAPLTIEKIERILDGHRTGKSRGGESRGGEAG